LSDSGLIRPGLKKTQFQVVASGGYVEEVSQRPLRRTVVLANNPGKLLFCDSWTYASGLLCPRWQGSFLDILVDRLNRANAIKEGEEEGEQRQSGGAPSHVHPWPERDRGRAPHGSLGPTSR
jgi:hypothetical protein